MFPEAGSGSLVPRASFVSAQKFSPTIRAMTPPSRPIGADPVVNSPKIVAIVVVIFPYLRLPSNAGLVPSSFLVAGNGKRAFFDPAF
jgi:hypothetical protein